MRKQRGKVPHGPVARRLRRKLSLRTKLSGVAERPRISVLRSNRNLFVQAIDDSLRKTLFSVQTFGKKASIRGANVESGKAVGAKVAEELKSRKIEVAVFDRSGYKYHGVVAAIADGIRSGGVKL